MNAVEIEQAISELAELPFDRAEFPFAFLEAFGNKATTLKKLRSGASNASDLLGGVLQRSNIHIATCDVGAVDQALKALRESPKTAAAKAKFILATDGEDFQAEDLNTGETVACTFADFPNHFGLFLPLAGITTVKQIRESTFDIRATSRLNKLYVELLKDNPEWATAERRADMNHFMARLIFCFFAEDTDIFNGEGLFTRTIEQMSARDSSNTHEVISQIFQAMDTPTRHEGKLDERYRKAAGTPRWADVFPYVNGQLFSGNTDVPRFSRIARAYLIQIGNLNWKKINPDIFGSMIQAVADDEERGALGMHYTSVPNILKVLNPLFLDDLRAALEDAADNGRKLLNLRNRMAHIRVFDPACGSGNFLVIAYKQMREIEAEINVRRGDANRKSAIPLTNFRGIELRDFPAEIARLALIIAEFQCDVIYRGQKEALADFLPLDSQNWITNGNALRLDWLALCPPAGSGVRMQADDLFGTPLDQSEIDFENEGGETYICGNPPYIGDKYQTKEQKDDLRTFKSGKQEVRAVDYIAGWFWKASDYIRHGGRFAFVSTNSICQGVQVPLIWPKIFGNGQAIFFAHENFMWGNNAARNAQVTCIIVGVADAQERRKFIYSDAARKEVANINPYLSPGDTVIVARASEPISEVGVMFGGNIPRDQGNLLLSTDEMQALVNEYPQSKPLIRPIVGSAEFINGLRRYCLWISDEQAELAFSIPPIAERLSKIREYRLNGSERGRAGLDTPYKFERTIIGNRHTIVVPSVSSERREYLPCGLMPPDVRVSNLALAIYDAPLWNLSVVASRLHLVWVGAVCGKLETRYRYSNTMGWNTFPIPTTLTEQGKADLTRCAEDILLAREAHFPKTIAELYDPAKMPDNLRHAHERNDEVLERIYIGRKFRNDTERLEKLFELYTKMTGKKAA
ncbi:class I SAM-dependent DNA methyltransferase [Novosphingobium pentaromativorans]|uniref:site-specific DNA-methyltransferase (adenine-specific) n=1 Tax=Novosphingobium pentaromativorans US6-1 TaxID=1088721 RepID=G6EF39_9SPHN|nr:DNA methyltransferase [Novosphingobium pentaromativorans]AIT79233.1 lactate dehydrogenase [Novosphingobium pentaromativorans US6-1]EHJ60092.1 putative DNA methylase [Novosphingobium pentaromativorans US6-1]